MARRGSALDPLSSPPPAPVWDRTAARRSTGRLFVPDAARGIGGRNANLEAHLLSYLRETLFDPERAARTGQTGVLIALAWLLTKSPLQPVSFSDDPHNQLLRDLGQFAEKAELGNRSSFQNLLYWARFLGFATVVGDAGGRRAFPDPGRAISAVLDRVLPDNNWVDMDVFLTRLAAIYPVLEGGSVREAVEANRTVPPASDGSLSVASSLALQRLADRGSITLDVLADAKARSCASRPRAIARRGTTPPRARARPPLRVR